MVDAEEGERGREERRKGRRTLVRRERRRLGAKGSTGGGSLVRREALELGRRLLEEVGTTKSVPSRTTTGE
jgi:hypothetical protein